MHFIAMRDIVLMFCHMNVSGSGALNCEEFLSIYDTTTLQWELQYSNIPWYRTTWWPLQVLCTGAHTAIKWPYFETLVCEYIRDARGFTARPTHVLCFIAPVISRRCDHYRQLHRYDSENNRAER